MVYPLIFSGFRYETLEIPSQSPGEGGGEKLPGGSIGNRQIRYDVKMIMMKLINSNSQLVQFVVNLRNNTTLSYTN